jgi:hypothetical protein
MKVTFALLGPVVQRIEYVVPLEFMHFRTHLVEIQ